MEDPDIQSSIGNDDLRSRGKRLFRRLLKTFLWILIGLITLVALSVAGINWYGDKAWKRAAQALTNAGEPTTSAELEPVPEIEDSENYGAIPALKNIMQQEGDGWDEGPGHILRERLGSVSIRRRSGQPNDPPMPPRHAEVFLDQSTDLETAAIYLESLESLDLSASGSAAQRIYDALGIYEPILDELAVGLDRPYARFSPTYEEMVAERERAGKKFYALHYDPVQQACMTIGLRAIAATRIDNPTADQRRAAFESLRIISRISESVIQDDNILALMVVVGTQMNFRPAFLECQKSDLFSAEQWQVLQQDLGRIQFTKQAHRGAQTHLVNALDSLHDPKFRLYLWGQILDDPPNSNVPMPHPDSSFPPLKRAVLNRLPAGIVALNRATLADICLDHIIGPLKTGRFKELVQASPDLASALGDRKARSPVDRFLAVLYFDLPRRSIWASSLAITATSLEMARASCALERYRIANGRYPESLTDLVPAFIEQLPQDPMSETDLLYRTLESGGYQLWSVGMDGENDGGKVILGKDQKRRTGSLVKHDYSGDWVWKVER